MRLFAGIFKARDKPKDALGGSRYSFLFGGTTAGKPVNEYTAMQMTAVYSCVRILSETLAGLPLHVYRYNDSGGKEKDLQHPLYKLLHDEPNPEMTSFTFRETLMSHLLLWGNAYAQIIRNARGQVIALYPLMPNKVSVDRDKNGRLFYLYQRGSEDTPSLGKDSQVYLSPSDVLHIPGLGFDGLVGYSPIAMAKNAVGLAIATEEYGAKFFANGAAPGGVLEHPSTIKDPQKVNSVFSSKLVCEDCGCFYGQKVWHSTDAYRKVIWQCNGKFKGQKKCTTPHLSIETIQRMFLRAYNQMMGDRERVIEDCNAIRMALCDCEKLDADIAKWHDEIEMIAGLVKKCVQDNASSPLPQGEYGKRYESLVKRYDKAVTKHESLLMERTRRLERDKELRLFTEALRTQPLLLDVWDERLWITLVEKGTVHPDGGIAFKFKDGTIIEVGSEI